MLDYFEIDWVLLEELQNQMGFFVGRVMEIANDFDGVKALSEL